MKEMTNWFAQAVSALVRPAVTIIFAAVIAQCVVDGKTPPGWFLTMAGVALAWYFGDRTAKHRAERKNGV